MARLSGSGPGEPDRTRHLAFGDLAAVWSMLSRVRVAEIVDEVVGPRRADAAASVGTYHGVGGGQPGRRSLLQAGVFRVVADDRRRPAGEGARLGPGSPAFLGCHGR